MAEDINAPAPDVTADEENPYLQFIGKGQGASTVAPTLGQRFQLHEVNAKVTGALLGAARQLGDSAIEQRAREQGRIAEFDNEAITRAVKTREDLAQYQLMPGADGFLDYGAAVAGAL